MTDLSLPGLIPLSRLASAHLQGLIPRFSSNGCLELVNEDDLPPAFKFTVLGRALSTLFSTKLRVCV